MADSPSTKVPMPGTGAKLIARMSEPTSTSDKMPPMLSTGSVDSFTCAGMNFNAMTSATSATGITTRKTAFHGKRVKIRPEITGPQALIAPPVAAQSAIELVRAGPDHNAAINARQVGNAIPAARPPKIRAAIRISIDGAKPAIRAAGIANMTPVSSNILRPWRSPRAPSHSTDIARPSE
jgi:hypothetical protein